MSANAVELRQYGAVLWRRKWLIVSIVGLALGAAWATGGPDRWRPRYRAQATLLVAVPPGQPAAYPVEAIRTLPVARDAVRIAGVTQDPSDALGGLSVVPQAGTSLVAVEMESGDARQAARLANAFADAYLARVAAATDPSPRELEVLRKAHQELTAEAVRVADSARNPVRKDWELRWLGVRDEVIARAYAERSLERVLGRRPVADARLLAPATPPPRPLESVAAQQARAFGGAGGLALLGAFALAFLLEHLDDRVRTEADVEEVTGLPVLATLPSRRLMRRATRRFVAAGRQRKALEGIGDPVPSPIPDARLAEAFQSLRIQIDLAAAERPLRTVLVASARNGGDKTLVTAYLGTVLAHAGRRTALISADLHRPELEGLFGVPESPGLGEASTGEPSPATLLRPTWIPNLMVVPAGSARAHPADVLASRAVGRVFETAQAASEWVLVEAPPVLAGAEAAILVPHSDGVLLVLEAGETSRAQAAAAKNALAKVRNGAVFLGVVLTNVPDGRDARRYNGQRRRGRPGVGRAKKSRGRVPAPDRPEPGAAPDDPTPPITLP